MEKIQLYLCIWSANCDGDCYNTDVAYHLPCSACLSVMEIYTMNIQSLNFKISCKL